MCPTKDDTSILYFVSVWCKITNVLKQIEQGADILSEQPLKKSICSLFYLKTLPRVLRTYVCKSCFPLQNDQNHDVCRFAFINTYFAANGRQSIEYSMQFIVFYEGIIMSHLFRRLVVMAIWDRG